MNVNKNQLYRIYRLLLCGLLLCSLFVFPLDQVHGEEPSGTLVTVYTDSSMTQIDNTAPQMRVSGIPQEATVQAYAFGKRETTTPNTKTYQLVVQTDGEIWNPSADDDVTIQIDGRYDAWSFWSVENEKPKDQRQVHREGDGLTFSLNQDLSFAMVEATDLQSYVMTRGYGREKAAFKVVMIDAAGDEVEAKNGKYEIEKDGWYRYAVSFYAPAGIPDAGEYVYQMPEGIRADGLSETVMDEDENRIGSIEATEDGSAIVLTMMTNKKIHTRGYFLVDLYFEMDQLGFPINSDVIFTVDDPDSPRKDPEIEKQYHFDAEGNLLWDVSVFLPKYDENQNYEGWAISDKSQYSRSPDNGLYYYPDLQNATVTLTIGEDSYPLHAVSEAGANEPIAYQWITCFFQDRKEEPLLVLVSRKDTHDACTGGTIPGLPQGWCTDWYLSSDSTLHIQYVDEVADVAYFGWQEGDADQDIQTMNNTATLYKAGLDTTAEGNREYRYARHDDKELRGPDILTKEFMRNGSFTIDFNKEYLDLSGLDKVTLQDRMSNQLYYEHGSLCIEAIDKNGISETLLYGEDYTINVDDDQHGMSVEILHPGTYHYSLSYRVLIEEGSVGEVYHNEATVDVMGGTFRASSSNRIPSAGMIADEYTLTVNKRERSSHSPVPGATYGLYLSNGELLAQEVSDANGNIRYLGDPSSGFLLSSDLLYYIQEIQAPQGYALDDTRYWFYYDDSSQEEMDLQIEAAKAEGRYRSDDSIYVIVNCGNTEILLEGHEELAEPLQVEDQLLPPETPPEVEKKVKDQTDASGSFSEWQDSADYDIGDDVLFQLTGSVSNHLSHYASYRYVFHDRLSEGLTLNEDSIEVRVDHVRLEKDVDYVIDRATADGCSFEIVFEDLLDVEKNHAGLELTENSKVTVEYTARLNEQAQIGAQGNPNTVFLEYANDPDSDATGTTQEDKVTVFTFRLIVNKIDEMGDPLAGAQFALFKYAPNAAHADHEGYVELAPAEVSADGTVHTFKGLDAGIYRLKEVKVPQGYQAAADLTFMVEAVHEAQGENPALSSLLVKDAEGNTLLSGDDAVFQVERSSGSIMSDVTNVREPEEPQKPLTPPTEHPGEPENPAEPPDITTGTADNRMLWTLGLLLSLGATVALKKRFTQKQRKEDRRA